MLPWPETQYAYLVIITWISCTTGGLRSPVRRTVLRSRSESKVATSPTPGMLWRSMKRLDGEDRMTSPVSALSTRAATRLCHT
jgi:hypothetical protein